MLRDPRLELARAELRSIPPEEPPNSLMFLLVELLETSRLPMRSPPPGLRFIDLLAPLLRSRAADCLSPPALRALAAGCCRSPPALRSRCRSPPALRSARDCRLPPGLFCLWRALVCRLASESPRAVPPYFCAVDRFE